MAAFTKHVVWKFIYRKERFLQKVFRDYKNVLLARACHVNADNLENGNDPVEPQVPHQDQVRDTTNLNERAVGKSLDAQYQRILLPPDQPIDSKILRVAIIGAPNSGKSTLSNQLMGWRVTSVSSKVHTTRKNTLAVLTEGQHQIVFTDTPGIVHPKEKLRHNLEQSFVSDPFKSLETADLVGVIVDISNKWTSNMLNREILRALYLNPHIPSILILNKVDDLRSKEILLQLTRSLTEGVVNERNFFVGYNKFSYGNKENLNKLFDKYEARTMEHYKNLFGRNTVSKGMRPKSMESITSDVDRTVLTALLPDSNYPEETPEADDFYPERKMYDRQSFVNKDKNEHFGDRNDQRIITNNDRFGYSEETKESSDELQQNDKRRFEKAPEPYVEPTELEKSQKLFLKRIKFVNSLVQGKRGWPHFRRVFMISALNGDGVGDLKEYLLDCCHPGEWEYHSTMVTDQDPQELAMMYVREKLLNYLPHEIPYQISPEIVIWDVDEDGVLNVSMNINTYSKRHFGFVVGRSGETIKRISEEAKQEMMDTFRCEMKLNLQVKLKH